MKVGVVGCGYVFDHYMATWARHPNLTLQGVTDRNHERAKAVGAYYGVHVYPSNAALLADPEIEIVANFTSIESHEAVTRAALDAGKHVYSEKPLTTDLDSARALAALADRKGLRLSCAPSNALSDTVQTMWRAVEDGAVGDVRLVYAEFDDNPVYLMAPETWRSRSGAPWPFRHEYEMGCTWEHVGYHLTWMCALFGPVRAVTAFSKATLPDKTDQPLSPPDTPDFSVACLDFESGVTARVTCSIAAPLDHRMRIIGNRGVLWTDTYRDYRCPVYLERFTKLTLNARKARSVRQSTTLQSLLGVGGRRLPFAQSHSKPSAKGFSPGALLGRLKRRETGQQDKALGLAELADAILTDRPHFPAPDFTLHVTELTLAIQAAGPDGTRHAMATRFTPVTCRAPESNAFRKRLAHDKQGRVGRVIDGLLDRAHQH